MEFVDVIIPLGRGSRFNNRELRFALRSIERFVQNVRNIYIATDNPPSWLQNITIVNIPDKYKHNKDANLFDKILAVCKTTDIGEYFLVWSDDQAAIGNIDVNNINIYNTRKKKSFQNRNHTWSKRMVNTFEYLEKQGINLEYNWDSHTPHLYKKSDIIKILESLPYTDNPGFCLDTTLMGLTRAKPSIIQDAVKINAEFKTPQNGWGLGKAGMLFIGYNDAAFGTGLQEELAGYLPNQSKYEKFPDSMCQGIDAVILSVNPHDPEWLESFSTYCSIKNPKEHCRYRYFHTLQYLFRGIEQNMPWIRKIHFVVSQPSQIPEWLDTDNKKINIVYHKDFMPAELLPTFNTCQIELFLYRIKGLSEHFVYFNDDMYPIKPLKQDAFFTADGKARMVSYQRSYKRNSLFRKMLWNNVEILNKQFPHFIGCAYDHLTHNLIKSIFQELVEREYDGIIERFKGSRTRSERDVTIQLVKDYQALKNMVETPIWNGKRIDLEDGKGISVPDNCEIVCFNDNEKLKKDFERIEREVIYFLQRVLPTKSSFEKKDWFIDKNTPILANLEEIMACGCSKDLKLNNNTLSANPTMKQVEDTKPSENDPVIQRRFWDSVQAYAAAVYDWYKKGKPNRTPEEMERCFSICSECEHFICIDDTKKRGRCAVCGCYLGVNPHRFLQGNKIAMKTQKCPEGKWE